MTLSRERQSDRMSKITNDGLTRSGTGCYIAEPMTHLPIVGVKGLKNVFNMHTFVTMSPRTITDRWNLERGWSRFTMKARNWAAKWMSLF